MNRPYENFEASLAEKLSPCLDWPEANQRWLARCFAQLGARLAGVTQAPSGDAGIAARAASNVSAASHPGPDAATAQDDPPGFEPAHQRVLRLFGLSPFEGDLLLLCAGLECDASLRQALAMAQGQADDTTLRVSFALALRVLPGAHWDAISPLGPLRHWSLVELDTQSGLANARLRIDERVLHCLTGVAAFDARLFGIARLLEPEAPPPRAERPPGRPVQGLDAGAPAGAPEPAPEAAPGFTRTARAALTSRIADALAAHPRPLVMLAGAQPHAAQFSGSTASARELALAALAQLQLRTLWVDAGALEADARAAAETARALDREAAFSGAALVIANLGTGAGAGSTDAADASPATLRLLAHLRSPLLLLGNLSANELAALPERRCSRFQLPPAQTPHGAANASAMSPALAAALRRAMQQFHVNTDSLAQALATVDGVADDELEPALWLALRESSRGGLDTLAQRIDSPTTLADLVLPAAALDALKDIVSQLRHRAQVHEDWGFASPGGRGLGLAALFAGDSGTGKTYAAEAVANEAGLDLYRIDLALTVSKYIGETEKNLRRLFDAAEASGAVLLFDEADALFGKRSEVKDSHDRYANIEVAYLLQRIESYRGLAILTTNLKSSLDNAFLRRLRFVVNFPFPDEAARAALWRRQFPRQAPLAADIDWRALAKLHLTGGHIRAVALNAAFRAAAEGGAVVAAGGAAGDGAGAARIAQRHLIDAARAEYLKLERSFSAGAGGGT